MGTKAVKKDTGIVFEHSGTENNFFRGWSVSTLLYPGVVPAVSGLWQDFRKE